MEQNTVMTNEELLKLAKRRVILKKVLLWHLIVYVIINALLCGIYFLTTPGGYFWPMWSMLGWGVGLVLHVVVTGIALSSTDGKQDPVEKEYQMLQKKLDRDDVKSN